MQDLTLVGLTDDQSRLVLVSDSGEEYALPADARLRAALRGDHARLGELEIKMDSALRPRDIQARIRAGESPETVAQAAQTTVDRIMGFATPVLAERAHVAERAQRASVRRKGGDGPGRVLGDAVAEQLRARSVDPESVEWDAWRRQDGRWTLVAEFRAGDRPRRAEFVFDAPGRYVVAEDDEARTLVGEPLARKAPAPRGGGQSGRRLQPVVAAEELPLGTDAIEMVSGGRPDPDLGPEQQTLGETGDLSPHETTIDLGGTAQNVRRMPGPDEDVPAERASAEEPPSEQAATRKSGRKGRRASVPSWDEIMFGGGRGD
jgi:hypothetical protein